MERKTGIERFFIGQTVAYNRDGKPYTGEVRYWDNPTPEHCLVREVYSRRLHVVHHSEMRLSEPRCGKKGWADLTPLERATEFPGRCCDCGLVISEPAIRCATHTHEYHVAVRSLVADGAVTW